MVVTRTVRPGLIAACLALPAVVMAAGLTVLEGWQLSQPDAALFHEEQPASLAEALTERFAVEEAYAFIRAGQDPNEPLTVTDLDLTGGPPLAASPLMLAVAAGHSNAVGMLISFGARLDRPENRLAHCLANELGNVEMIDTLARYQGEADSVAGPNRLPDAPTPLGRWVAATTRAEN